MTVEAETREAKENRFNLKGGRPRQSTFSFKKPAGPWALVNVNCHVEMSSPPPSMPLMRQNSRAARPHVRMCQGCAPCDHRAPSRHAACPQVPPHIHTRIAADPPTPPASVTRPPHATPPQTSTVSLALDPPSKRVNSPAGPRPLVNPRQSSAAHSGASVKMKIRQIRQNPSNLRPRSGPYYPPMRK